MLSRKGSTFKGFVQARRVTRSRFRRGGKPSGLLGRTLLRFEGSGMNQSRPE